MILEHIVKTFVSIAGIVAVLTLVFVVIDLLVEHHRNKKRALREEQRIDRTTTGVLIGLGVLSLLGHGWIAHHINKKEDCQKTKERRKRK